MDILTPEALAFVADLQRRFGPRRSVLLAARRQRGPLGFRSSTASIRSSDWRVPEAAPGLVDRRVEITGPTERKMAINALNSGARVWLADLEDANTPHWRNVVDGQVNLYDAVRGTIAFSSPDGRAYALSDGPRPTIVVRPRGWHLFERHLDAVGAFVDFGLYAFHNAAALLERGSGPYFYLPKMESADEASLWHDVFVFAEGALGLPAGSIRATVLIETIPAAFEMDEILHALGPYAAGLNAGRWDYLFSIIKNFPSTVLPDRSDITMAVPFMRAYARLLVATCHRRGAYAIGGMAAFIPSRRDPAVNETAFAKVREDKEREVADGFDGSWVAHPDLVPLCASVFPRVHQLDVRPSVSVTADDLLDFASTRGAVTSSGVRANVSVGIRYIESWLRGVGAAGINNLMEDAATAEISRSQIWQWIRAGVVLDTGVPVTPALVRSLASEEFDGQPEFAAARELFERVALADDYVEFLTLPGYELID